MAFEVPNLTLLRHFVAVAEDNGITRASKRLRISQPALSKNIRKLEVMLGTRLFERHASGTELTEAGRRFFNHAQTIGLEYEHALQEIQNVISDQESTIRLGTGPVWTSTVVPAALPRFHRRYPRHRVMIQTGSVDRMIEDLRLGRIDVFAGALIRQNQFPGYVRKSLTKARMAIMCSPDHPLAKVDGPIDPVRIVEYPFVSFVATTDIMEILSGFLKSMDAPPPRNMIETSSIYACVELVRSGGYLFFESEMIARSPIGSGLNVLDLPQTVHEFDMGFVYRKGLDRLPPFNGILTAMKDVLDEHTAIPTPLA